MSTLVLHHFPGACSQVTLCALEASGLDYRVELVDLSRGAQKDPAYLAKSPLGKVPMLETPDGPLTENAALLVYLARLAPDSGILPPAGDRLSAAAQQAGLSFCGGTLHPIVRGIFNPARITTGDGAGVRERSIELADKAFAFADARLEGNGWWLGERSIIDAYLAWAASIARAGGYAFDPFPAVAGLHDRLLDWPAFAQAQRIEDELRAERVQ